MNWANTMAANADDATTQRALDDRATARNAVSTGSWDPHEVWLTRVKQPRDDRRPPPGAAPVKLRAQPTRTASATFSTRAAR
jgi:hypothetical protein